MCLWLASLFFMKCDSDICKDAHADVVLSSGTNILFKEFALPPRCVQGSCFTREKELGIILLSQTPPLRASLAHYFSFFFFGVVLTPSFLPEDSLLIVVTRELSCTDIFHSTVQDIELVMVDSEMDQLPGKGRRTKRKGFSTA